MVAVVIVDILVVEVVVVAGMEVLVEDDTVVIAAVGDIAVVAGYV